LTATNGLRSIPDDADGAAKDCRATKGVPMKRLCLWFIPLLAIGCQTEPDAPAISLQTGALSAVGLPSPRVSLAPERVWTQPAQKARAKEVEAYLLATRYAKFRIMDTVRTAHGTVIDYVDAKTAGAVSNAPPVTPKAAAQIDLVARPETEESPALAGPPGSIPFVRPDFALYVSGDSGYDSVDAFVKNRVYGRTDGLIRLYGGYKFLSYNAGAYGTVTAFSADAVENGTFTLMEMATACPQDVPNEIVGVMFSRDLANHTDQQLRLHVEFYSQGFAGMDDYGLVPYASRTFAPGVVFGPSTVVGTGLHYETFFQIQQFQGNWWVYAGGTWLGYYPGSLFTPTGLGQSGCRVGWYGEVFDPSPTSWTHDSMGNGTWASAGWSGYAAYWRNFAFLTPSQTNWYFPDQSFMFTTPAADANCYTTSPISWVGGPPYPSGYYPIFYLGGPGGKNPNCK
jgi:hypothetical protein